MASNESSAARGIGDAGRSNATEVSNDIQAERRAREKHRIDEARRAFFANESNRRVIGELAKR